MKRRKLLNQVSPEMKIDKVAEQKADLIHKIENLKEWFSDEPENYMSGKQLMRWWNDED